MKKRMSWLLGEKKKCVLVPIMMAVALFMSSMTVFAYSSYKEAEIPIKDGAYVLGMTYSEDKDAVLFMEDRGEDIVNEIDHINFNEATRVFHEESSDEYMILEDKGGSDYLLCLHDWTHGRIFIHESLSGGRCKVKEYEGDVCKKCQSERNMVYIATHTYAKCPH